MKAIKDKEVYADPLVRIVMDQLAVAADRPALLPEGFENIMYACRMQNIPDTAVWFEEELRQVLEDQNKEPDKQRWRDLPQDAIVSAAVRQIPGHLTQYRDLWMKALNVPRFADYALLALSEKPHNIIDHLGLWWNANPPNRERELRRLLQQVFNGSDKNVVPRFQHFGGGWDKATRDAISEACSELGLPIPFPKRKK